MCECGQVNSDDRFQRTLDASARDYKPTFQRIAPELAMGIKHSNLLDAVQIVVNRHKDNRIMQLLIPRINETVQLVCKYMTQYTFKQSTAL